jgi:hypothetical protein
VRERERSSAGAATASAGRERARGAQGLGLGDFGPLSGPVGWVFFLQFRNADLRSSKIYKNSPKIFINKILIFRLIIIIFLNYCLITKISF